MGPGLLAKMSSSANVLQGALLLTWFNFDTSMDE